jgi:hypothetical protein
MIAMDARCLYTSDVHGHTAAHLAGWKGWDYIIKVRSPSTSLQPPWSRIEGKS